MARTFSYLEIKYHAIYHDWLHFFTITLCPRGFKSMDVAGLNPGEHLIRSSINYTVAFQASLWQITGTSDSFGECHLRIEVSVLILFM